MPKIPTLDKINEPKDVPCIRNGCKANSKARCMSPEGVHSPRVHGVRQYLFAYITLKEMPEKPNSVTFEEKQKADKLAQDYLGEIVVQESAQDDETVDNVVKEVLGQDAPEETPPVAPEDTELGDAVRQQDEISQSATRLTRMLAVANPSDMLTTLLQIQGLGEDPQEALDVLREHRAVLLEIMNLLNELEMIDLQRAFMKAQYEDKIMETRSKILDVVKATENTTDKTDLQLDIEDPVKHEQPVG